jgi:hypothetical protein
MEISSPWHLSGRGAHALLRDPIVIFGFVGDEINLTSSLETQCSNLFWLRHFEFVNYLEKICMKEV